MPDNTNNELDKYFSTVRANQAAPSLASENPQRFDIVQEQVRINDAEAEEEFIENTSFIDRATGNARESFNLETGIGSGANYLGGKLYLHNIDTSDDGGGGSKWSFNTNPIAQGVINKRIEELGIDVESEQAADMRATSSIHELDLITEREQQRQAHQERVKNSGLVAGELTSFISTIPDIDMVLGGAIFKPLKKASDASKLRKVVQSLPKGDAIYTGAKAGFLASLANESARHAVGDSETQELLGAVALGTVLGAGVGGVVPTRMMNSHVESTTDYAASKQAHRAMNDHPTVKNFRSSMSFTGKWEGGMANVTGDRGGKTAYGISEKNFPEQYAEMEAILKDKGEGAAKQYRDRFFKTQFYDKVVKDDMSPAQAQVMFDTAITSGQGTAKKLWKKSGGDVNKFLDARDALFHKIVKDDPSQAKFLKGWLNRNADLRSKVGSRTARTTPEREVSTPEGQDDAVAPTAGRLNDTPEFEDPLTTPASRLKAILDEETDTIAPVQQSTDSVGSASVPDPAPVLTGVKSQEFSNFVHEELSSPEMSQAIRDYQDWVDPNRSTAVQAVQKTAERIYKAMDRIGFLPDHDRALATGNPALQWLALKLTNSPVGMHALQTADNIKTRMHETFEKEYKGRVDANFNEWLNDQDYDFKDARVTPQARLDFGKEVQMELNARRYGESHTDDVVVNRAADEYGATTASMLRESKKAGVQGFEDVEFDPGYFPVRHRRDKIAKFDSELGTKNLELSYKKGILEHNRRKGTELDDRLASLYAMAIVRHARERPGTHSLGSLHSLSEDSRLFLEDTFKANGVPESQITQLVDDLLYKTDEGGTVKRSRRRIGIDYSTPIEGGNGETLFDLIDQDVFSALDSLVRGQAGEIARVVATDGVLQKRNIPTLLQAITDEARLQGRTADDDLLIANDLLSQFSEGAFSGGLNRNVSRLNQLTTLSFMPQIMLPQIAETGIMLSKGGVKGFQRHIGEGLDVFWRRQSPRLANSLAVSGKYLRPDELVGSARNLDEVALGDTSGWERILDHQLHRGSRMLGEVSLFHRGVGAQQVWSANNNNQFIIDSVLTDKVSDRRLIAMGVGTDVRDIVNKYKDVIERDASDGAILDNHFEHWDPKDVDRWRDVVRMNIDYDVQASRAGFGHSVTQRNDLAALTFKLKTFAMNAFYSKMLRNARLADKLAAVEMTWSLGTAAIAVSAWATVNGKWDDMDEERFATRVLSWSAHASPALMLLDPIAYIAGVDYMTDGNSSPIQRYRGHGDSLMGLPAPISALNNMASIPRSVASLLDDGDLERDNINALKSIPIIGRMYGIPLMLDAYYDSTKEQPLNKEE